MITLSKRECSRILAGVQTRTTQRGKRRWQSLGWTAHPLQRGAFGPVVGAVRIVAVHPILLGHLTEEMVQEEGYPSLWAFKRAWRERYGKWDSRLPVWDIRFRLIEQPGEPVQTTLFDHAKEDAP